MRASLLTILTSLVMVTSAFAQAPMLSVRHDAAAKELIFEIGPLHLEANADHGAVTQPAAQAIALPVSGFLHSFTTEMLGSDDQPIPSQLLHHVNIIAPQKRELFSDIMQRVGAAGSETGPVSIPRFLGYPVTVGDSLLFTAMFHNPTNESYHNARLRIRMRYSGEKSWYPRWAIQPFYMDVMPPAGLHVYDLPPGRSTRSWEGRPAVNGRILGLQGHLHRYGVALRLEDVTEGKVLFETRPQFDEEGGVSAMPRKFFLWKLGIPIRADRTYRLTATYDNPTNQLLPGGGMGALGGVFMPDDERSWPAVDRTHPDYQYDRKVTNEGSHGGHGSGGHTGH